MANSFLIKTIIFDIGGVIVNSFGKELVEFASDNLKIEPTELRLLMNKYEPALQRGETDHVDFWEKIVNDKGINMPPESTLKKLWMKPYIENVNVDQDMIRLVKSLKNNYIVGCISNSIEPHTIYNKKRGLYSHFDPCVLSDEVNIRKPDKEIFELYFKKVKCNPGEAIFIDDEAPLLTNAKRMGIHTIVFKNIEQLKKELAIFNINIE